MISHRDLLGLAGWADYFSLIGDYLRGATTEVQFETDQGDQFRTHIIVDAALFPSLMIAVEGSDSAVVARRFFALPEGRSLQKFTYPAHPNRLPARSLGLKQ